MSVGVKQTGKQNLRPHPQWKKGVSGNPHGRPRKEYAIADMLRKIGDSPPTEFLLAQLRQKYGPLHNPKSMKEAMLLATYAEACTGSESARAFIAERTEGKVSDKLLVEDTTPARVQFVEVRQRVIPGRAV